MADHDTFWRVTFHVDLAVPDPAVMSMQPMTFYYQVDVDKQTATPSMFAQG